METHRNAFRDNTLLRAWRSGVHTVNGWLALPDACCAEAMAHAGWDSLTIDMQHGLVDYHDALAMLQAISTTAVMPLVRVPWLDEGIIMKMLDAGAYGIICPMINTPQQALRFARACRYPPRGVRSIGPVRAALYAGPEYASHADDMLLSLAMVETLDALANLDAILDVDELSGIYIGPSDLSLAHGLKPGMDREEPVMLQAIGTVIEKTAAAGRFCGIHCASVAYAYRMLARGANFATVGSDMRFVSAAASAVVEEFRRGAVPT